MEILTRDYGVVEINAASIIHFDEGIIGFEDYHEFVLLDCSGGENVGSGSKVSGRSHDNGSGNEEGGSAYDSNAGSEEGASGAGVGSNGGSSPFRCLQSVEDGSLAFMLLDPFIVRPDYEVEIDDEVAARLSIENNEDIAIFSIVVVPENIKLMSFNLKAPIIINARVKKGTQYIVDNGDYGVRHYLADEIDRAKCQRLYKGQAAV